MKFVARTCRELLSDDSGTVGKAFRLDELQDIGAFVLLGAPGSGKTTLFRQEAEWTGGVFESARNFITLVGRSEWHGRTLFIDALDERRSTSPDPTHPLDCIRSKLDGLRQPKRPKFRISCREADWLGANDRDHLKRVSPDGSVRVFRLDALDQAGILEILAEILPIGNPEEYVEEARDRRVSYLLENPLTLKLLVEASQSSGWPASRAEMYERACSVLTQEPNDELRSVNPNQLSTAELLKVSGELCALQLMTGNDGYSEGPVAEGGHSISLQEFDLDARGPARQALHTRLFSGPDVVAPIHRHIAEFLAGRYLADRAGKGTPLNRLLALVTGHDGHVVSELQGTTAWLAAHCKESRASVMERDPVGTLLYGDISRFTPEEKVLLVQTVARHLERHSGLQEIFHRWNPCLADLATPDMAESFRVTLRGSEEDSTSLRAKFLVLRALQAGPTVPTLADEALRLVREEGSHHQVRSEALDAYIRQGEGAENHSSVLAELLMDVWHERISDPEDELFGKLLIGLYPKALSAEQAVSYLRSPKNHALCGTYWRFWSMVIAEETDRQRIAQLLDAIADRTESIRREFEGFGFERHGPVFFTIRHLAATLIARYLKCFDSQVEPPRLYSWLEAVSDRGLYRFEPNERQTVQKWLEDHPDIVRSLVRIAAERSASEERFKQIVDRAHDLLLDSEFPPDLERWCLDQSKLASDVGVSAVFKETAETLHRRGSSGSVPVERAERVSEQDRSPSLTLEEVLADDGPVEWLRQLSLTGSADPDKIAEQEWRTQTRENFRLIAENRSKPAFLEWLAEVYFGNDYTAEGANPRERLLARLQHETLVEVAVAGLRGTLTRNDTPTYKEVLKLHGQGQWYRLALPFLAGMEETDRGSSSAVNALGTSRLRLAVAFHYTKRRQHPAPYESGTGGDGEGKGPRWYMELLDSEPDLVADVLVGTVRAEVRKGLVLYDELWKLLREESYSSIVRRASLPLLKLIPVRCTAAQLDGLELVLKAALRHCDEKELKALIEEKLARESMTVGQRVYWLAAGLFLAPAEYRRRLEDYVSFDEERIAHLAKFVAGDLFDSDWRLPVESLDARSCEAIIARVGRLHRPLSVDTQALRESEFAQALVERLGSDPSAEATRALQRLLEMPELEAWRAPLQHFRGRQAVVRRNASFTCPSIEAVRQTLANSRPANAADLSALATDRLERLAREIRDGNASLWRQFWNEAKGDSPMTPRYEELCRNLLLELLRAGNPAGLGVEWQPEGRYADDKRADIRVSSGGFNVPVEIKRSMHRELWTAVSKQLVTNYTRDPAAEGYGVYAVLWFGVQQSMATPPKGTRPRSACELRGMLRQGLGHDERMKISIVVFDVEQSSTD
ncbi:MAG: hypothetical protein OXH83_03235 [Bryobacterales bacterium]|nr:hypothetical protein [Bryobacterales bacterium]